MFRHGLTVIIFLFLATAAGAGEAVSYDRLPRRLAEMDQYERIAMEPYPNYDSMPLHQKAELYGRQFEFMRGRKPVFSPVTLADIERTKAPAPRSREELYKPPEPKKPKASTEDLAKISGPWSVNKPAGPEPPPPQEETDYRMETLRKGRSTLDLIKDGR